ncbi:glycoside hydrolase family 31 protein [Aliiglaciecola sp. CAU 1673]|uniref:glycoside hydrolase family 31 protein n=1 Tax=Aliiglaciecola sp. CAU 1673 TaxID=3032595 RepID=UPI0023DB6B04|nr:TIM-barrel domain-containing protein [Aliiglaciecola sp. CAU 1673]MDF2179031.1 glycoside hydrolase family 31 protein [Aliiglaciecola sp. CAU 1673]
MSDIMKLSRLFFALLFALLTPLIQAAELQSYRLDNGVLHLMTDAAKVRITPYQGAFEVFYQPVGVRQLPSYAIDPSAKAGKGVLEDKGDALRYCQGLLCARIEKAPLRLSYYFAGDLLLAEESGLFVSDTLRGFRFKLNAKEKLLGGGQRVLGMDRRGQRLPLYNRAHYGYTTESEQMYFSLPAVLSSNKYLLVFDNTATGHLDLGHNEKDVLQFEALAGRTSYLVAAGEDYPAILANYTAMTGRQPLPPRWALGNYASRFGYRTESETRDVVKAFADKDVPLDAVVLDLYWFGKDIQGHMGNLDWDNEAFPTPEKMIADFKQQGVNTILITEPFVLTTSSKWQEAVEADALAQNLAGAPKRFDFYFGNTGLIDVFNPKGRDWFWQTYDKLLRQGVGGWWGDLGEPEVHPADTVHQLDDGTQVMADEIHNAYGHQWAKMVFEKHRKARPNERPFIMMRSGFAGSQRFGMIPWTGDVSREWGGLKPQVELSLTMGLLGLAYTHSDLGGFAGGETFDAELYTRWLQYGVFQPVYRPHAQEHIAPEPIFHDDKTLAIVRDFIKLRYALLPYNYTLSYLNSQQGLPMMRPLFFEDDNNLELMDNKTSYLWGDAFLVTPVTEPGLSEVKVQLPEGVWYDYFSGELYQGGTTVTQPTTLETLPVLVRSGSFIPMVAPVQSSKDYSSETLQLHYYHHPSVASAKGLMYDDDGKSFDAVSNKQYELLHFSAKGNGKELMMEFNREAYQYPGMPKARQLELVVHHYAQPLKAVSLAGKSLPLAKNQEQWQGMPQGVWQDLEKQKLYIKLPWQSARHTLSIQ